MYTGSRAVPLSNFYEACGFPCPPKGCGFWLNLLIAAMIISIMYELY
jgi:hypothetical protein